jgi:hypothetical protein
MKKLLKITMALLAICMFAVPVSLAMGISPLIGVGVATGLSFLPASETGVAFAGIQQEIWTGVLVEQFRETEDAGFLNEIPDESRWVQGSMNGQNETIHLNDIGADPEVLINNTAYPIGTVTQVDGDISINLDKYQTKATVVTDDEIQYLSYDKQSKVTEKHTNAVMTTKYNKALHSLAPNSDTTTTPVIVTTGDDDGTGRNKMVIKDLLALKRKFDVQKIPLKGRVVVLCSDHYNDLLEEAGDKPVFSNGSLADSEGGLLSARLHGFKVYWYVDSPYFNPVTKTKLSFGSVPAVTDRQATVAFYAPDMFRANGSTTPYYDKPDTQTQAAMFNIRHYYITLPRKNRAIGAIVSSNV